MKNDQYELLLNMIKKKKIDYELLGNVMPYAKKVWYNEIKKYNFEFLFEIDDGICLIYDSFNKTVDEFIKYDLDPVLFLTKFALRIRRNTQNLIRSNKINGHYVLNNHDSLEKNGDLIIVDDSVNTSLLLDNLYNYCKKNIEKKIIEMKIIGYTNIEISKILRISKKKVENILYILRRKLETNNFKQNYFFKV